MFHQHFNTPEGGGAIRSYYLATALVQHGHRVTMITSCACQTGSLKTIEGINVIYLPVPYNNRFTFYARSWSFLRYVISAIRAAVPYKDYDVAYGISAPLTVGICTRWMRFRYGMPYLFEVGDLWPDAPIQLGFIRNPMLQRVLLSLERSIYQHARSVVALSQPIADAIQKKLPERHVDVIPNMADIDFFHPEDTLQALSAKYQTEGKFVVSYVGAFGVANGLHQLINCIQACHVANLPAQFILCGDGAMLDELKGMVAKENISNVLFAGFLNREGVREVLRVSDAVFISYLPAPILETGCPNKYFDGLAAGKLIIVNFGGWIREEIESHECGFYVDPAQPKQLAEQIVPFINDRSLLKSYQQRSRALGVSRYSREKIGSLFAGLFSTS